MDDFDFDYSIQLTPQDIYQLECEAANDLAEQLRLWWSAKSKSPKQFYKRLSQTVGSEENCVVADGLDAGLAKYIADKRDLIDQFIQELQLIEEGRITVKKYNL